MSADDILSKPISLDQLQQFKMLNPLPENALSELAKIETLDVASFYEAEVRAYVIDPIVRILGYDKGTDFSVDLGRPIQFLDKNKFPDYRFNLWQEDFWLIEAKRPRPNEDGFGYDDLQQAIEYAIHPNINAALVVLCDGLKLEVFDREVSLTEPVLRVAKSNLRRDFDKIRRLLEPMQVWFFQKRRIVRLLDKVFDKEFNLQRVEEFRSLIERRLASKRSVVLENFRRNVKPDDEERKAHFLAAPLEELVDVHMFFEHSIPLTNTLIFSLVARCEHNSFHALYRVFPDLPRDANDIYMAHAVAFLIALAEKHPTVGWLPAWLARGSQSGASVDEAAKYLLKQCLSYFEDDEPRKIILLASAAIRRVFKLFILSNEAQWRMGEVLHFLGRYQVPELSWSQIVSSPEGHLIGRMSGLALIAANQFVVSCRTERGEFKPEVAKLQLKELWKLEKALLKSVDNYPKLRKERDLGDMSMVEWASVAYDNLGHTALCLLHGFPQWTAYALEVHRPQIETLASIGSWKARELLGLSKDTKLEPATNNDLAQRFFFGDVETLEFLRMGYSGLV
jgi:hypothetical protein